MELLRLSPRIEVLSPDSLRKEIASRAEQTVKLYGK